MKNIITAIVLSMFAVTAFAAEHDKDGHKKKQQIAEYRMQKLTKKLALTEQQQDDIKTIHAEAKTKIDALKQQYKIQAYHKEKRLIRSDSRNKVAAVLTDKQKVKFHQMKKQHKNKKCD